MHCILATPQPGISNVFQRAGIRFHQVTGVLKDDPECWREVDAWVEAGRVVAGMADNRLGLMGHYCGGMLDICSDVTLQCATFGTHVEILEVDELAALRGEVTPPAVEARESSSTAGTPPGPRTTARSGSATSRKRSKSWGTCLNSKRSVSSEAV